MHYASPGIASPEALRDTIKCWYNKRDFKRTTPEQRYNLIATLKLFHFSEAGADNKEICSHCHHRL